MSVVDILLALVLPYITLHQCHFNTEPFSYMGGGILHMEEVVPFLFDDFFFSRIHVIVNIDWHKNGLKRAISEIGNPFLLMVSFSPY